VALAMFESPGSARTRSPSIPTGVSSKGYARYVGPNDGSEAWGAASQGLD
jgi:hypothetical protein